MTSDSDPDYSDAEQISQVEIANHADREKQLNADGVNVCGKDVNWVELYRFATAKEIRKYETRLQKISKLGYPDFGCKYCIY